MSPLIRRESCQKGRKSIMNSRTVGRSAVFTLVICALLACQPSDRRPGLWLSGEEAAVLPQEWGFSNAHQEIFVQVSTPYLLPHSVTIWCAELEGELFIGARNPDEKHWPGWIAKRPQVVLKIADTLYRVGTEQVRDKAEITAIKAAYAAKYNLPTDPAAAPPPMRYWRIKS